MLFRISSAIYERSFVGSMVKLETYHFSTVVACASSREITGLSLPLAINCSKITVMGACGITTLGHPVDINRDPLVGQLIRKIPEPRYLGLVKLLVEKQFKGKSRLPDAGMCG